MTAPSTKNPPASAVTVLVRVPIQTAGGLTVVVALALLFAGLGSLSAAETVAEETRTAAAGPGSRGR